MVCVQRLEAEFRSDALAGIARAMEITYLTDNVTHVIASGGNAQHMLFDQLLVNERSMCSSIDSSVHNMHNKM